MIFRTFGIQFLINKHLIFEEMSSNFSEWLTLKYLRKSKAKIEIFTLLVHAQSAKRYVCPSVHSESVGRIVSRWSAEKRSFIFFPLLSFLSENPFPKWPVRGNKRSSLCGRLAWRMYEKANLFASFSIVFWLPIKRFLLVRFTLKMVWLSNVYPQFIKEIWKGGRSTS